SEFGPHPALGIVHQVATGAREDVLAILSDEFPDPALAELDRTDHGAKVAVVVAGRPDVREHQLPDVVIVDAAVFDLHGRHAKAFLEDLGSLAIEGARHGTADLGDMADA